MQRVGADIQGGFMARQEEKPAYNFTARNGTQNRRPQTSTGRSDARPKRPLSGTSQASSSVSSYSRTGKAQYSKALSGARKSRIDKFQARFTFSHNDPKYYSELPVQPATGWWKALLIQRRQSPLLVERLCKNLDVLLPDTIYTTSTECYYITNSALALEQNSVKAQYLTFPEAAGGGWLIREEFSASKFLERNAPLYLKSAGFPGGFMKRRTSARPSPSDCDSSRETAMAVPAAVVKQPHYAAANRNVAKALDLLSMSSLLADSSSERLVQVRHHKARRLSFNPRSCVDPSTG